MPAHDSRYNDENGRLVMARLTTVKEQGDRSFDIEFWQRLSEKQRMDAMWELVETAHKMKGGDPNELRLQRTVECLKQRKG